MEEERNVSSLITKFHAHLLKVNRGEAASKKHGSWNGARKRDGSTYGLIFRDTVPCTLVQQVQG